MAKAAPKAEAAPADGAPKSKKTLIIIVALVLVLLLGGGGAAFFLLKGGGEEAEAEAAPAQRAAPARAPVRSAPATFMTLDPFTTNLARENNADRFVQIVAVLKLIDPTAEAELATQMPELRHRVNIILGGRLPSELSTMEGREDLADEIMEEANDVLGFPPDLRRGGPTGPVDAVLFNSIIIQ